MTSAAQELYGEVDEGIRVALAKPKFSNVGVWDLRFKDLGFGGSGLGVLGLEVLKVSGLKP